MKLIFYILFIVQLLIIVNAVEKPLIAGDFPLAELISNSDDPCSVTANITCAPFWTRNGSYVVDAIYLEDCNFNVDYREFKYLTKLVFGKGAIPPSNFFDVQLKTTNLYYLQFYGIENYQVPSNTTFPFSKTLQTLVFDIFYGTYYSSLFPYLASSLIINDAVNFTFEFPEYIQTLTQLQIPIPKNGFSSDLSIKFPSLYRLDFILSDVESPATYSSSNFGTFNYPNLAYLNFRKSSLVDSLQGRFEFPDISNLNLYGLNITGQILDLGNSIINLTKKDGVSIYLDNVGYFLKNCNNCFKLSNNNKIYVNNSILYVDNINLSNSSSIIFDNISPDQEVSFNTMDFDKLTTLIIKNSMFYGDLSDEICKVPIDNLYIQYNNFAGSVPSCFTCTLNEEIRDHILPNKFESFNENTPIVCKNFKVFSDITKPFIGHPIGYNIEINGKDLGFDVVTEPSVSVFWKVPNENFSIEIPTASSSNINDKTMLVKLVDGRYQFQIEIGYFPPYITGYTVDERFNVLGDYFSYIDKSNVEINRQYNITGSSFEGEPRVNVNSEITDLLKDGEEFTLSVYSNGMKSNEKTFVYFSKQITIDPSGESLIQPLNDTGGILSLTGSFLTSNKTGLVVLICGLPVRIISFSNSSLTLVYPELSLEYCYFEMWVFGQYFSTDLNIQHSDVPFVDPFSSSSDSSDSSDSSGSQSEESSDQVSSSSKFTIYQLSVVLLLISVILI